MKVLVLAAVALAFGVPSALACNPHPTEAGMEGQLMCPTCKTPLEQSDAPAANRIRHFVSQRIAAGDDDCQIRNELADQFGPGVLAAPPRKGFDLLAWLLPLGGLLGGAVVLGVLAWRWSRSREPSLAVAASNGRGLDVGLERRVDEELGRFE